MNDPIRKRSIVVAGRKTSVSLEGAFWKALHELAADANQTLADYVTDINAHGVGTNFSSSLRLAVLAERDARIGKLLDEIAPQRKIEREGKIETAVSVAGRSLLSDEQRRLLDEAARR